MLKKYICSNGAGAYLGIIANGATIGFRMNLLRGLR